MAAELFTSEEGYHHRLDRDNYTNIPFDIHITIYNETKGDGFLSLKLSFFELRSPFQSFNVSGFIDDTTDHRVELSRFLKKVNIARYVSDLSRMLNTQNTVQ
jgi:hypothetical protein